MDTAPINKLKLLRKIAGEFAEGEVGEQTEEETTYTPDAIEHRQSAGTPDGALFKGVKGVSEGVRGAGIKGSPVVQNGGVTGQITTKGGNTMRKESAHRKYADKHEKAFNELDEVTTNYAKERKEQHNRDKTKQKVESNKTQSAFDELDKSEEGAYHMRTVKDKDGKVIKKETLSVKPQAALDIANRLNKQAAFNKYTTNNRGNNMKRDELMREISDALRKEGNPSLKRLLLALLAGGGIAAGGSIAANKVAERSVDKAMRDAFEKETNRRIKEELEDRKSYSYPLDVDGDSDLAAYVDTLKTASAMHRPRRKKALNAKQLAALAAVFGLSGTLFGASRRKKPPVDMGPQSSEDFTAYSNEGMSFPEQGLTEEEMLEQDPFYTPGWGALEGHAGPPHSSDYLTDEEMDAYTDTALALEKERRDEEDALEFLASVEREARAAEEDRLFDLNTPMSYFDRGEGIAAEEEAENLVADAIEGDTVVDTGALTEDVVTEPASGIGWLEPNRSLREAIEFGQGGADAAADVLRGMSTQEVVNYRDTVPVGSTEWVGAQNVVNERYGDSRRHTYHPGKDESLGKSPVVGFMERQVGRLSGRNDLTGDEARQLAFMRNEINRRAGNPDRVGYPEGTTQAMLDAYGSQFTDYWNRDARKWGYDPNDAEAVAKAVVEEELK